MYTVFCGVIKKKASRVTRISEAVLRIRIQNSKSPQFKPPRPRGGPGGLCFQLVALCVMSTTVACGMRCARNVKCVFTNDTSHATAIKPGRCLYRVPPRSVPKSHCAQLETPVSRARIFSCLAIRPRLCQSVSAVMPSCCSRLLFSSSSSIIASTNSSPALYDERTIGPLAT